MRKIIRLPKVMEMTGMSRSSLMAEASKGSFPKPLSLPGRRIGWLEEEIELWIDDMVNDRLQEEASRGEGQVDKLHNPGA